MNTHTHTPPPPPPVPYNSLGAQSTDFTLLDTSLSRDGCNSGIEHLTVDREVPRSSPPPLMLQIVHILCESNSQYDDILVAFHHYIQTYPLVSEEDIHADSQSNTQPNTYMSAHKLGLCIVRCSLDMASIRVCCDTRHCAPHKHWLTLCD